VFHGRVRAVLSHVCALFLLRSPFTIIVRAFTSLAMPTTQTTLRPLGFLTSTRALEGIWCNTLNCGAVQCGEQSKPASMNKMTREKWVNSCQNEMRQALVQ
jgi:hypothetical protein